MDALEREQRLTKLESSLGRKFGWFVEAEGRRVAQLTEPKFEDMFWCSYVVEPLAEDEPTRTAIFTPAFWQRDDLVYRNRVTGEIVSAAFPGGRTPTTESNRVWMRGLYLWVEPTRVERFLLWYRRWRRRSQRTLVP